MLRIADYPDMTSAVYRGRGNGSEGWHFLALLNRTLMINSLSHISNFTNIFGIVLCFTFGGVLYSMSHLK